MLNKDELYGHWWTHFHKPYHIVAWFNFAKMFSDKEIVFRNKYYVGIKEKLSFLT